MATQLAGLSAKLSGAGAPGEPRARIASELEHTRKAFAEAMTLPGDVYTSAEVMRLEQRGLFARQWLCVGRDVSTGRHSQCLVNSSMTCASVTGTHATAGGTSTMVT